MNYTRLIVFITHDLDEALRIGDTIAILRDGAVIQQGDPQDIILNPADDYIVDFIRDINRGRVVQVRSLMEAGASVEGPEVKLRLVLEDALSIVANSPNQAVNIVDGNGQQVGAVSLNSILAGLARPAIDKTSEARYR